jgi:peptide/nickel transport system ATP-binding protein
LSVLLQVSALRVVDHGTARPLVESLGFTLDRGRTLGIVGESGSGKTMTAMAIAGLLPATVAASGSVSLDGVRLAVDDPASARDARTTAIGIVFQNPNTALNPRLTVGAQIVEAMAPALRRDGAAAAQAALALLEEVGVPDALRKLMAFPHELSGGLAQRVVIAMALARTPKLLIADEPTTALDVTVQAQILDLMARLQKQRGFGMLLISHDMGVIYDRTDDVLIMARGSVVETGATRALFRQARSAEARALLRATRMVFAPSARAEPAAPLLTVSGLCKTFRRGPVALRDVSFEVAEHQCVGIVGESGSGKTTLARIIAGLDRADSGAITLDGRARAAGTREAAIQYIFQDAYSSLDPRMAIIDTVAEPLLARGDSRSASRDRAGALLAEVGLDTAFWRKPPTLLSGGQRQRVGIARAIATEPRLLIADEPTAALDGTVRERVLLLLQTLGARLGMSQLLISHDLATVARICTHVVVLKRGEIVEQGPTRAIFGAPAHPYTRQLLRAIPARGLVDVPDDTGGAAVTDAVDEFFKLDTIKEN